MFEDIITGGLAGGVSRTVTAPLELYKIQSQNRFMPHSTIWNVLQKEGFLNLWKGNGVNCIRVCPQISINYAVFEKTKSSLEQTILHKNTINFLSGLMGGMIGITCIYPLETIRTRLSLQTCKSHYSGMYDCFKKMGRREMYQGLGTSIVGFAPFNALSFTFFYYLKNKLNIDNQFQKLICGGLSGMSAVTITYPTDLVRRRLQLQGFDASVPKYTGMIDCIKKIIIHDGFKGLYRGLGACYMKIFPTLGVQFWTIEKCNELFKT